MVNYYAAFHGFISTEHGFIVPPNVKIHLYTIPGFPYIQMGADRFRDHESPYSTFSGGQFMFDVIFRTDARTFISTDKHPSPDERYILMSRKFLEDPEHYIYTLSRLCYDAIKVVNGDEVEIHLKSCLPFNVENYSEKECLKYIMDTTGIYNAGIMYVYAIVSCNKFTEVYYNDEKGKDFGDELCGVLWYKGNLEYGVNDNPMLEVYQKKSPRFFAYVMNKIINKESSSMTVINTPNLRFYMTLEKRILTNTELIERTLWVTKYKEEEDTDGILPFLDIPGSLISTDGTTISPNGVIGTTKSIPEGIEPRYDVFLSKDGKYYIKRRDCLNKRKLSIDDIWKKIEILGIQNEFEYLKEGVKSTKDVFRINYDFLCYINLMKPYMFKPEKIQRIG